MNATPFIFGGDTGLSYDEIQRMRAIAQSLQEPEKITTVGEGIRSAAQSIAGGWLGKRGREEEAKARGAFDAQFAAALGGGYGDNSASGYSTMGGGGFTPRPAPQPVSGPISAGPGGTSEGLTPQAQDEWNKMMTPEPGGTPDNPFWDTQGSAGRVSSPDELDEREILARTIQMEAGNQGPQGMFGVGAVMDNRRRSGRFGGNDFRSVALAPAQFSPWNSVTGYAGGEQGSMAWQNPASPEAYQVADAILSGQYEDPTGGATHFVNHDISNPGWASKMSSKGQIGAHTFYSDGGQGIAGATPDTVGGGVRVAQNGPFQDLDQQTMRLIELANSPWASPGQKAMIGAMIDRRQKRAEFEWQQANQGRWEPAGRAQNGATILRHSLTGDMKTVGDGGSTSKTYQRMTPEQYAEWGLDPETDGPYAMGSDGLPTSLRKTPLVDLGGTTRPLSKGEQKVDEKFADDYLEWTQGGKADYLANRSKLDDALEIIEGGSNAISGPWIGRTPEVVRAFIAPQSLEAKQMVEEVVQRNLRLVLGAQFTEKEGERLIARAYNDNLDEATNARRVKRLMAQIDLAAQAKKSQVDYYEKHSTLRGWEGDVYTSETFEDLLDDMDEADGLTPAEDEEADYIFNPETGELERAR